ncbi:SphA family protein [Neorhizobium huautlense]|uniref:SphA family protein n=1 Tax=Neorhizobium huautlense TaxID=67774 RepID=UPI0013002A23|nr:transporter [Neorhizobium huautlense]
MNAKIFVPAALTAILFHVLNAGATEQGRIAYPIGVNTVASGMVPKPGQTWLQNFSTYYTSTKFSDEDGNSLIPGFEARVSANALKLFHTWDGVTIGPFSISSAFAAPFFNIDTTNALTGKEHSFSVGDVTVSPAYFGWSNPEHTFFAYAGVDLIIPTKTKVSNDFYSINPIVNMTWFPTPELELNLTGVAEFHTRNSETEYRSGTLLMADWAVLYHLAPSAPQLAVGLNGYAITQVTDDTVGGAVVGDGFRQQGFAIGPQITYAFERGGGVAVKWQHEFGNKYSTRGDRLWMQVTVPLGD